MPEIHAEHNRHGEDVVPVRDGGKYARGNEFAEEQDFLLVTRRAEPPAAA